MTDPNWHLLPREVLEAGWARNRAMAHWFVEWDAGVWKGTTRVHCNEEARVEEVFRGYEDLFKDCTIIKITKIKDQD